MDGMHGEIHQRRCGRGRPVEDDAVDRTPQIRGERIEEARAAGRQEQGRRGLLLRLFALQHGGPQHRVQVADDVGAV